MAPFSRMKACGWFGMRSTTDEEKFNDEKDQVLSLRTDARR
jgi:hypothetical protein